LTKRCVDGAKKKKFKAGNKARSLETGGWTGGPRGQIISIKREKPNGEGKRNILRLKKRKKTGERPGGRKGSLMSHDQRKNI